MEFSGKKITVMGLGLLGRGVGDARWLAEQGAQLIVTDLKSREELAESVAKLEGYDNIKFVLGEHRLEDFRNRDIILKGPSVPLDSTYISEAKRQGIPIRMSADVLVEQARKRFPGIPTIGVTGTRGKSTVTHLLAHVLRHAKRLAAVGGNVRGVANLPLIDEITAETTLILELDSWQLQGFGEAQLSPNIAILTTFFPDHLNYYEGDLDAYLADKANIFLYQGDDDYLVIGRQAVDVVREKYNRRIKSHVGIAGEKTLPKEWRVQLPGAHNRYNAGIAACAARLMGIEESEIREAIESFAGVPGRLELVHEEDGVRYYNDTTATTPEATLAALRALATSSDELKEVRPHSSDAAPSTVLIAGGADKGLDVSALIEAIPHYCKALVLLPGTGSERLPPDDERFTIVRASSMQEAVDRAREIAKTGDTVLLSPAFASFGLFQNEFDRGEQFAAAVKRTA